MSAILANTVDPACPMYVRFGAVSKVGGMAVVGALPTQDEIYGDF